MNAVKYARGQYVAMGDGHYYVIGKMGADFKVDIYGIGISEIGDAVKLVHKSVPYDTLIPGDITKVDPDGELAVARDYILSGKEDYLKSISTKC